MTNKYLDREEQDIIEAYKRGEFIISPERDVLKASLQKSASNYLKKTARINIRLPQTDLEQIKIRAAHEGMPYQTLIASVLHKYVNGSLTSSSQTFASVLRRADYFSQTVREPQNPSTHFVYARTSSLIEMAVGRPN